MEVDADTEKDNPGEWLNLTVRWLDVLGAEDLLGSFYLFKTGMGAVHI